MKVHFGRGAALLILCALAGCASVPYALQAAAGQWEIARRSEPIDRLLAAPGTDPVLRERLRDVQALREFAARELALPVGRRYGSYVDLGRRFVLWNVFAAPALSLEPRRWCYPLAGCFGYRGYFSRRRAEALATRLRAAGDDAFVGGVTAYSTLGWFADPVLSSMLGGERLDLARVLFHELAHVRVYLDGDTELNEAFATVVADEGVARLAARMAPGQAAAARLQAQRDGEFLALMHATIARLNEVYRAPLAEADKLAGKRAVLDGALVRYRTLKADWGGFDGYDAWIGSGLDNAKLSAIATYHDLVPDLAALLARGGGDLPGFYERVASLGTLPADARRRCLRQVAAGEIDPVAPVPLAAQCR